MASVFSAKAKDIDKPVVSTVMVHGNKMVRMQPTSTEIIDLDRQTITQIDREKRAYTVMTFAQFQEAINNAAAKAKEQRQQKQTPASGSPDVQMNFHANITNSGAVKQIDGRDAKEALLTLVMDAQATDGSNAKGSMAVTSEMWMIPDAPGYDEIRQFQMRMARLLSANLDTGGMAAMFNMQPGAKEAMENLKNESEKMKGIPVLQAMRMGVSADGKPLPAPSVAPLPKSNGPDMGAAVKEGAADGAAQTAGDQIAKLGTFGRAMGNSTFGSLMRHRKSQATPPDAPPSAATLFEATTQLSSFSAAPVDASNFEVPAGYKQVEARKEP
jgi:hypothetical protein